MECQIQPSKLRCENLVDPLAISTPTPRLSWKLSESKPNSFGLRQIAYEIRVASTRSLLETNKPDLWSSGRIESDSSHGIVYKGEEHSSPGDRFYWQVRVWDQNGTPSDWSDVASWQAGILTPSDWKGEWIGASNDDEVQFANQHYRRKVILPSGCTDAIIYVASQGYHDLYVNGTRVGDTLLSPAISAPRQRVRYVAYDITSYLRPGTNVVCIDLGAGWTLYEGHDWSQEGRAAWPRRPALQVQAFGWGSDGNQLFEMHSDTTWKSTPSEVQPLRRWKFRDFGGEQQVAAKPDHRWTQVDFDDSSWNTSVVRGTQQPQILAAQEVEPNRSRAEYHPVSIKRVNPDTLHISFERMFTGFLDLELTGKPNSKVSVYASDRSDVECVYNQEQIVRLDSKGQGKFRNRFNYVNAQWLTIRGDVDLPTPEAVKAILISTDLERVGHFRCSSSLHNQIYDTAVHTLECLDLGGYIVDCAHRERLGYGGDGQVTSMAMMPNFACAAFYEKWLQDWCDVQQADGNLPFTAPTFGGGGGPGWSGFIVHVSADLYERDGDKHVLEMVYPSIKRWLQFLHEHTINVQLARYDGPSSFVPHQWSFLGDWVYPGHDQSPNSDSAETSFLNNCYYVWTLQRAANIASVLGKKEDARTWQEMANDVGAVTHKKYWDASANGYRIGRQANLAIAILAKITPEELRPAVNKQLEKSIVDASNGHLDTGIPGTAYLLRALQQIDRVDLGVLVSSQRDFPSWGQMIEEGATAFWEQWDGIHSRCHSSYLGIGGWYIESIAGIQHDPSAPGYKNILFKPGGFSGLSWAEGEFDSPRGLVKSSWRRNKDGTEFYVTIPPNSTGDLYLPLELNGHFTVNGQDAGKATGVRAVHQQGHQKVIALSSGVFKINASSDTRSL